MSCEMTYFAFSARASGRLHRNVGTLRLRGVVQITFEKHAVARCRYTRKRYTISRYTYYSATLSTLFT